MLALETVAGDARVFVEVSVGQRIAWLSAGGIVRSATIRVTKVEAVRCPLELLAGLGPGTPPQLAAQLADELGMKVLRLVRWPEFVYTGESFPESVGMVFGE